MGLEPELYENITDGQLNVRFGDIDKRAFGVRD